MSCDERRPVTIRWLLLLIYYFIVSQQRAGKRVRISLYTRMSCFHYCQSELEPINTCEYCSFIWPRNECRLYPFLLTDKSQMLVGVHGFFIQSKGELVLLTFLPFVPPLFQPSSSSLWSAPYIPLFSHPFFYPPFPFPLCFSIWWSQLIFPGRLSGNNPWAKKTQKA